MHRSYENDDGRGKELKRLKRYNVDPSVSVIPLAGTLASAYPQSLDLTAYNNAEEVVDDSIYLDIAAEFSVQEEVSPSVTLLSVLGERQALELQILNAALYMPEVTSENINLQNFTPKKVERYRALGGRSPDLKCKIGIAKQLWPQPIRDTVNFPRDDETVWSPVARNVPRGVVRELRAKKLVFHLPDYAISEPIVNETKEERTARKERQKKEFEESEALLGNFPKQLISEREKVLKPWVPYFNYVKMKKDDYSLGIGEKMRWSELGAAFMKYVAPQMEYAEIEDFEVYFSLDVINFDRENPKNKKKNYLTMSEGGAPIGVDGESIHLHHILRICARSHPMTVTPTMKEKRQSPYKLAYVPEFIHTEYTEFLHPANYISPKADIDRAAFGDSRKRIHKKIVELEYSVK